MLEEQRNTDKIYYDEKSEFEVKNHSIKNISWCGNAYKQRPIWVSNLPQDKTEDKEVSIKGHPITQYS